MNSMPEDPGPKMSRRPAFLTPRFLIVLAAIVVLGIVGAIIAVSASNSALVARETADQKAQQAAADKANAANAAAASPSLTPSASASAAALATAPPVSIFSKTLTWPMATSDGYKFNLTLELASPAKVAKSYVDPENPAVVAGKNCSFNATTDAVVLGNISAVAQTPGFPTPLSSRLVVLGGTAGDGRIEYEGQTVCKASDSGGSLSQSFDGNWSGSGTLFDQGQSTYPGSGSFMIILKDYFSPAHPTGDQQWAQSLSVYAAPTSSQYGTPSTFYPVPSNSGFSTAGLSLG